MGKRIKGGPTGLSESLENQPPSRIKKNSILTDGILFSIAVEVSREIRYYTIVEGAGQFCYTAQDFPLRQATIGTAEAGKEG